MSGVFDKVVGFEADAEKEGQDINITVTAKLLHTGFIAGPNSWNALRHSYVVFKPGQPACVLALDDHAWQLSGARTSIEKTRAKTDATSPTIDIAADRHSLSEVSAV